MQTFQKIDPLVMTSVNSDVIQTEREKITGRFLPALLQLRFFARGIAEFDEKSPAVFLLLLVQLQLRFLHKNAPSSF